MLRSRCVELLESAQTEIWEHDYRLTHVEQGTVLSQRILSLLHSAHAIWPCNRLEAFEGVLLFVGRPSSSKMVVEEDAERES
jgi:hypothetical protein